MLEQDKASGEEVSLLVTKLGKRLVFRKEEYASSTHFVRQRRSQSLVQALVGEAFRFHERRHGQHHDVQRAGVFGRQGPSSDAFVSRAWLCGVGVLSSENDLMINLSWKLVGLSGQRRG